MKHLYVIALLFCITDGMGQIVNIPDNNFRNRLLQSAAGFPIVKNLSGVYFDMDTNGDNQIQVSEAQQVSWMYVRAQNISSLVGIEHFTNMTTLHCDENFISNLNLSGLSNLGAVYCDLNDLTSLNVQGCLSLTMLECSDNLLTSLNLDNTPALKYLMCFDNQLTYLDLHNLPDLENLSCSDNNLTYLNVNENPKLNSLSCGSNQLTEIFMKNGATGSLVFYGNPNLAYICCDPAEVSQVQTYIGNNNQVGNPVVNSYCSFTPGGTYYSVVSSNKLDSNMNGCDDADPSFNGMAYSVSGIATSAVTVSATNPANLNVVQGSYTITPVLENPDYYIVSPTSVDVEFPTQASPVGQLFCVSPNGVHSDLEVVVLPTSDARPGFDSTYKVIYRNKGNVVQSGSVTFDYHEGLLDVVSTSPAAVQTPGLLTWNYSNLQPTEVREAYIVLNLNSPAETPAANIGMDLGFNGIIYPITGDEFYPDNQCGLKQVVVGSYDPNDKRCIEGNTIDDEMVGQYVHYIIRFENTGNYPAENVVVNDVIDVEKFDPSTLVTISGSHSYETRVTDGNKVEFIFENIDLPFDDATNDGYVAFKIKTLPTLVPGDTFSNNAAIYFDYNLPIITNDAVTTITNLGTAELNVQKMKVYPNPVTDLLHIASMGEGSAKIEIFNGIGQLLQANAGQNFESVNVSGLAPGTYFLKMTSDVGTSLAKFMKQ